MHPSQPNADEIQKTLHSDTAPSTVSKWPPPLRPPLTKQLLHLQLQTKAWIARNRSCRTWPISWLSRSSLVEKGRIFVLLCPKYILICLTVIRSRPEFHPTVSDDMVELTVDPTTSPTSPSSYNAYGRIYQRQTSPFIALNTVVVAGILHETADSEDETTEDKPTWVLTLLPSSQTATLHVWYSKQVIQCWNTLCSIIPNFREQMLQLSGDPKTRKAVCSQVSAFRSIFS